jgi:hypothetical protein
LLWIRISRLATSPVSGLRSSSSVDPGIGLPLVPGELISLTSRWISVMPRRRSARWNRPSSEAPLKRWQQSQRRLFRAVPPGLRAYSAPAQATWSPYAQAPTIADPALTAQYAVMR